MTQQIGRAEASRPLRLDFPESVYCYSVELAVRYPDINIGRHLGADKMVTMLTDARDRFLAHFGFSECEPGGIDTLVTDLSVVYRAEVPPRSELCFDFGMMDFNRYGANIVSRVRRGTDNVVAAYARSGFVFFDPLQSKVVPVPDAFRTCFARLSVGD